MCSSFLAESNARVPLLASAVAKPLVTVTATVTVRSANLDRLQY